MLDFIQSFFAFLTVLALGLKMFAVGLGVVGCVSLVACAGIILASICRINALRYKNHSWLWVVKYTAYAAFAFALAAHVIDGHVINGHAASKPELIAMLALALNLLTTSKSWADGPPKLAWKKQS